MNSIRHIFIDESGDTSIQIQKQGVSNRYILVAVIVGESSVKAVETAARKISKLNFSGAEIKSSKVGNNINRRRRILSQLSTTDFKYYAYVVNKSDIYKESGLQYKEPFYKYLNGNLYERICLPNSINHIHSDMYGRSDFMESFQKYIRKRYETTFFQSVNFDYVDSKNSHLVQVADFISGTLARCLDKKDDMETLNVLRRNEIYTYSWPPKISRANDFENLEDSEKYNQIVKEQSVSQAKNFIYKNIESNDSDTQAKIQTLEYLLHRFFIDPGEYIYSPEIIEHLSKIGLKDIKSQALMSGIIAPLRDSGVVIASCNKGYKIPNSTSDLHDFVKTVDGLVVPYVERLNAAREIMMLASGGDYDIVSSDEFPKLKSYIESSKYK